MRTRRAAVAAMVATGAAAACAATMVMAAPAIAAPATAPTVRPVAGAPALRMGAYAPGDIGYVAKEYFVSGDATSYATAEPPPQDGRWNATAAATAPYATRIVVLTPSDPKRFNGTVVVEWLNVTGGADAPAVWLMAHRHMIRQGYAYVAVSAQKVGVEGGRSIMGPDNSLKRTDPQRYGALNHPGDAYAYDIFSQAGRLVRASRPPAGVLGPLTAKRVLAVGESQSATFLATYVNAVDPLARVYDGFLVHSRFGGVSGLGGGMALGPADRAQGVRFRPDLRAPVLTFITESDLVGFHGVLGFAAARQPDTGRLRTWEVPGASHADNYTIAVAPIDTGKLPLKTLAAAYAPTTSLLGQTLPVPINFGPQHHYVVEAALDSLERWVSTGKAPATSPRIELTGSRPPTPVLDEHGLAKGGVRTPWVDAPTARLSGEGNPGGLMAALFGTGETFAPAKLKALYPGGKADYLKRFEASLDKAIAQGFIVAADRPEILGLAALTYPAE